MTYDLNWSSTQTLGTFLKSVGDASNYWVLVLFFEFMLITIIGSSMNKKSTGYTNVIIWLQLGSFATTFSAVLLMLGGFVNLFIVIMCVAITVIIFIVTELGDKLLGSTSGL